MKIKMTILTLLLLSMTFSAASAEEPLVDPLSLPDENLKDMLVGKEDSPILPEQTIHTVKEGDNLHDIAAANNISVDLLMEWNGLTDHVIYPKDRLVLNSETELVKHPDSIPPEGPGKEMIVEATAYTAYCYGCIGITAYGIDLRSNPEEKVIAVDPAVIPLGTKVWVEGYGEAVAGDTGGAIKGNRIDVFIPTYDGAIEWGRQEITLKILE
ncbi:3D domain-containing protein [Psychrobacillus sp. NPDC096623]|uniref:3D domain-containing protein n=1 Tax=Psychrobacillus sp. NPDC096623 TaxID=3364492 RepID=UPI003822C95D